MIVFGFRVRLKRLWLFAYRCTWWEVCCLLILWFAVVMFGCVVVDALMMLVDCDALMLMCWRFEFGLRVVSLDGFILILDLYLGFGLDLVL